jgi:hypothetical protein
MERLRTKYDIDKWCPADNTIAFLACDTAADANDDAGSGLFQHLPAPEQREYFLLRFFPHGTGIQQQDIRIFRRIHRFHAVGVPEHIRHLGGIILIHLTAECLYVKFAGHLLKLSYYSGKIFSTGTGTEG